MKIYTRKGDAGLTQLADGQRVPKTHPRIVVAGDLDELNSHLGLLLAAIGADPRLALPASSAPEGEAVPDGRSESARHGALAAECALLVEVQRRLFDFGAWAVSPAAAHPAWTATDELVTRLEQAVDRIDASVGGLFRGFVLPGGHPAAAQAHVVRCVCRRVERSVLLSVGPDASGAPSVTACLNRLSDFLFALARKINAETGVDEKKRY